MSRTILRNSQSQSLLILGVIEVLFPKRLCCTALVLTASLGVLVPACASATMPKLRATIIAYYKAEKENDWRKVYRLRTKAFQQHVLEHDFVVAMEKYNAGWKLNNVKILAIQRSGEKATVEVRFTLAPPRNFWQDSGSPVRKYMTLLDEVIWVLKSGEWRCKVSSSMGHLPFTQ